MSVSKTSALAKLGNTPTLHSTLNAGYCPFLTYSGNGMLVTAVLIGVLLSVYRHQNIVDERKIGGKTMSV